MFQGRDRRLQRSGSTDTALGYFLKSCAIRLGLRAIVLGSRDGLLLAAYGDAVDPDSAAAYAPLVYQDARPFPEPVEESYFVEAIPTSLTTLYLFVVGQAAAPSLARNGTTTGIRRILEAEA